MLAACAVADAAPAAARPLAYKRVAELFEGRHFDREVWPAPRRNFPEGPGAASSCVIRSARGRAWARMELPDRLSLASGGRASHHFSSNRAVADPRPPTLNLT